MFTTHRFQSPVSPHLAHDSSSRKSCLSAFHPYRQSCREFTVPCSQISTLAGHSFSANRSKEPPGSEVKGSITYSRACRLNISILESVLLVPSSTGAVLSARTNAKHAAGVCRSRGPLRVRDAVLLQLACSSRLPAASTAQVILLSGLAVSGTPNRICRFDKLSFLYSN